jgi:hypothetical protein
LCRCRWRRGSGGGSSSRTSNTKDSGSPGRPPRHHASTRLRTTSHDRTAVLFYRQVVVPLREFLLVALSREALLLSEGGPMTCVLDRSDDDTLAVIAPEAGARNCGRYRIQTQCCPSTGCPYVGT